MSYCKFIKNNIFRESIKKWIAFFKQKKPYRIIEIIHLSNIPGESKFAIQITNKNLVIQLKASNIINSNYNLNYFSTFHADMIRQAALGKLFEFLKLSETEPAFKIISKKLKRESGKYIFIIETKEKVQFSRTAEEIGRDKNLLDNMCINDIYDIGYTHGTETTLKEKTTLLLAKNK